nr:penicillin-binding protein activator LpoB [bacterium]
MRAVKWIPIALGLLLALGCSGMGSTTFVHPDYNFGYLEKVAVIPFENTSKDQGAGVRVTRFYVTELLSAQTFDVVEPGEVARVLAG